MLIECKNELLLKENIINSMSYSYPDNTRYNQEESSHYSTCLPCVIRRASIKKANIQDNSYIET